MSAAMSILFTLALLAVADEPTPPSTPDEVAVEAPAPAGPPTPESLAPWARAFDGRVTVDSPHYDLELMYFQEENEAGLAEARRRIAANPEDTTPYWMAARFLYEIGERFDRNDPSIDKAAHYQAMIDVSEAGLAIEPNNAHLLFALGIGHGRLGTTKGVLSSLFRAKTVEQSWLATVNSELRYAAIGDREYLPCDAHEALAIYYRLVPDWWIVSVIAGTRGDLEKSVSHAEASVACAPDLVRHEKELGVAQICYGQKNKDEAMVAAGIATLEKSKSLVQRSNTDRTDHKHVQMLLDNPDLACEYSRDGQQDLDESKLEK
jgi:tetratricopeptide (TPR) repeat protein